MNPTLAEDKEFVQDVKDTLVKHNALIAMLNGSKLTYDSYKLLSAEDRKDVTYEATADYDKLLAELKMIIVVDKNKLAGQGRI